MNPYDALRPAAAYGSPISIAAVRYLSNPALSSVLFWKAEFCFVTRVLTRQDVELADLTILPFHNGDITRNLLPLFGAYFYTSLIYPRHELFGFFFFFYCLLTSRVAIYNLSVGPQSGNV